MTDYLTPGPIQDKDLNPAFREREQRFREEAGKLWETARSATADVRGRVDLEPEQREEEYLSRHEVLELQFNRLSGEFVNDVLKEREEARKIIEGAEGKDFSQMLASAASAPAESLPDLLDAAKRSNETGLMKAIGLLSLSRGDYATFNKFKNMAPRVASALQVLHSFPSDDQLSDRIRALQPPKARPEQLVPTMQDHERAASEKAAKERERQQKFGSRGYRRMVGSRTEQI